MKPFNWTRSEASQHSGAAYSAICLVKEKIENANQHITSG